LADYPSIDRARCNACGLCVTVCGSYGLTLADGRVQVAEGIECDWCRQCEIVCPAGAIAFSFEVVFEEVEFEAE
jgi:NAD-dependent dihydropyrimidine dehydrogenase PreA subunit